MIGAGRRRVYYRPDRAIHQELAPVPIYVETKIRGSMDDVWRLTQTPELHQQWDLRFSSITYLPRQDDSQAQRFRYATRLGFGLAIEGWGETMGEREAGGVRTSALRFGSDSPWSLIRTGSGYWKYEPSDDGIRFLTGYDYQVRWGRVGKVVDRLVFRPLMGWATAWSFDRLRLWIESGVEPRRAARQAFVHGLCAVAVAFVWFWHGLVPKLLGPHPDEIAMLLEAGVAPAGALPWVLTLGALEVVFGLAFVPLARFRWPWIATLALMGVATLGVAVSSPQRLLAAFNPLTLNVLLAVVATVGLVCRRDVPFAGRCLRVQPKVSGEGKRS